ncbi:MAG: DUF3343 domain-containing protein [Clostridiales bacterium]|nr:DUF3343 domain-containing protein [Clostridiales bacterium]
MICIATFYSHFGAIRFKRTCDQAGLGAMIMPVPRDLSSSCGTCVRFEGNYPEEIPQEIEQIVVCENGGYRLLYRAENA